MLEKQKLFAVVGVFTNKFCLNHGLIGLKDYTDYFSILTLKNNRHPEFVSGFVSIVGMDFKLALYSSRHNL